MIVGGYRSLFRRAAGAVVRWTGVVALTYHRIGDGRGSPFDRGLWSATEESFDRQVRWLKRDFDVIAPHDVEHALRAPRGRHVIVTFDDGYADNHSAAYPILRAHRVPGTFFVATGFLDGRRLAWWDEIAWMVRSTSRTRIALRPYLARDVVLDEPDRERAVRTLLWQYKLLPSDRTPEYLEAIREATGARHAPDVAETCWMTWDMVRELHAGGMTIGAHTVNHPILSRMDAAGQRREIQDSTRRIGEELGVKPSAFSYPVGHRDSFDGVTRRCLAEAGIRIAFSYYGGFQRAATWDPYDARRHAVEQDMTMEEFRAAVLFPWI